MKNLMIRVSLLVMVICSITFSSCEDKIDPLIEEMELDRVLAPTGLTARIRNLTTVELTWDTKDNVDQYIVEFSEDSLEFNTIIFEDVVTADELPYQHAFAGETRYSARVKAVREGTDDSTWATVTIETAQENIFLPQQNGDIDATEALLRWTPNADVTHFIITPGGVERTISAEEKTAGMATITGLTGSTPYSVQLKNGTKNRGIATFETLVDLGGATRVDPENDLAAVIAAADPGATLVLFPGDYTVNNGATIAIDKSITIKGYLPYDKPKLHVSFNLLAGAGTVEMIDLDMSGSQGALPALARAFNLGSAGAEHTLLSLSGCNIHDFGIQLIYGNVAAKLLTFSVDNCIVSNFTAGGGDFIDFRPAHVGNINITNSTFNNVVPGRDFVRVDAAATYTGTGLTTNVLIDHCTLYGVSNNTSTRRILYVRFNANVLTVRNTLIANTTGIYTNQTSTSQPTCLNNNYFNAPRFYDAAFEVIANLKIDNSGTHSTLDPGFVNAAAGDFTITNQSLIDEAVGDPRWRPAN